MKGKKLLALLGSACLVLALAALPFMAACAPEEVAPPPPPPPEEEEAPPEAPEFIKVGTAIQLSGMYASGGQEVLDAYEIGVEEINAKGGVYVKEFDKKIPIKLIAEDDESDLVKTVRVMEKLYSVDEVVVYLFGFGSSLAAAQAPIAEKNRVPWIGSCLSVEAIFEQGYRYVFAAFGLSSDQVRAYLAVLDSLPADVRPTTIANWELQSDWGLEMTRFLKEENLARGSPYKIIRSEYSFATTDFSSLIIEAKAAGIEVIFSTPTPPQAFAMAKQMKELDYTPKAALLQRGCSPVTWGPTLGKDGDYFCNCQSSSPALPFPGNKEFNEKYRALRGVDYNFAGAAYSCIQILVDAIERAGTLDRDKIRDAIAATDMMTVQGPIKFKPTGKPIIIQCLLQWQDGEFRLVWPSEYAEVPFFYPATPWKER